MTRMTENDPLDVVAAHWFARLEDSTVRLDEVVEWQSWMRADARHAAAFARIEEAWEAMLAVSPQRVESSNAHTKSPARWLALAASVVVAGVAATWVGWALLDSRARTVSTAVGENQTVRLADGSKVTLGGRTKLAIHFDDERRRVEISHGEALFTVAKDVARPFEVQAGDAVVIAVGTEFNVRRGQDRVVVAVVEGRVLVTSAEQSLQSKPVQLNAGEQSMVSESGVSAATRLAYPAATTAWREGLLSFQREPLRYVVEDVNRYASKPVIIEDDSVGEIRITGTVMDDNIPEWISSLEAAFGLEAAEEADRIVLREGTRGADAR